MYLILFKFDHNNLSVDRSRVKIFTRDLQFFLSPSTASRRAFPAAA